ncbi:Cupin domain-containing protein [Roseomonas rosea]|uniref:Cupin domain-containing protein n=1 Tax=Muricoccus roseus TaxID=198092 RepID=A0A1M6GY92_9PROT|nr:cupin domain-containing protein [Roseomonas rosea]SHJ14923.1 Cupin domain-containing protein [Roseomonas rosea]
MRTPLLCGGFALAFAAGLFAARIVPQAEAQPAPGIAPRIVNLTAMTEDEIGPLVNNTDLRSRTLVATEHGTVAVQSGNVFKHFHSETDEIQLILDGTGSFWLGDREVQVKPGDLIVIPRGTHHAGSRAATGRFRALAIKLPPQRAGDTHPAP